MTPGVSSISSSAADFEHQFSTTTERVSDAERATVTTHLMKADEKEKNVITLDYPADDESPFYEEDDELTLELVEEQRSAKVSDDGKTTGIVVKVPKNPNWNPVKTDESEYSSTMAIIEYVHSRYLLIRICNTG